jgi:hypothetical protein
MDMEMKHRAVVESLLLDESLGEEITQCLRNVSRRGAYSRIAIFR